ncbi:L-arabinose transport system permease protein AraQ [Vibrio thalassae]|uniref:L-arabinose transport system permease protein AraQ n=1 Tax=Vibrio thalassae TaxID=1243014 RepID=A0A240EIV8_9VIBR|nr:carbohydrate ABC transporter permease [Vibrio thalassae]SNX48451.1 L-arabinose transport system permease protein AraQ [Vibrio thalassae]
MKTNFSAGQITAYGFVAFGAIVMLAPFYFMFVFATHDNTAIMSVPPPMWFGNELSNNLAALIEYLPYFWKNLGWSFYVAAITTALNLLFCSLAGYAFAMFEFRYKKVLFVFIMGTLMLPAFLSMIPTALIMSILGWMNTPKALYVPMACGAMGIFLMRQYIGSAIPRELIEAARVDGCSEFGIYWRIVVPLIKPALGTLGLVVFIGQWNNFMGPLVVMNDMEMYTVPLALRALQGSTGLVPYGAIFSGVTIAVLPLMVMFVISSRKLIDGLTAGAVKG